MKNSMISFFHFLSLLIISGDSLDFQVSENGYNKSISFLRKLASDSHTSVDKRRGRKAMIKALKLQEVVAKLSTEILPEDFIPLPWCKPHNFHSKYVIFTAAMYKDIYLYEIQYFLGTARKVGIDGDIVIASQPNTAFYVNNMYKKYDAIVYNVSLSCAGDDRAKICGFYNQPEKYSINMIRYFMYRWWASKYSSETYIMISDFRDVFFQSNPFLYKPKEWAPPAAQLVVFQEAHPNSVINRCKFNKGWIKSCYGIKAVEKIGHNTVSCSGVSMGTRDAILVYSYLMTLQTLPKIRLMPNATAKDFQRCISPGMDQGFHNWMIYSGMLNRYMDVRIFQQGEGPVNTLGGFYGKKKILQFSLEKWGILQGKAPHMFITNWNGDRSPVVHQLDRFAKEPPFRSFFKGILEAMTNI